MFGKSSHSSLDISGNCLIKLFIYDISGDTV